MADAVAWMLRTGIRQWLPGEFTADEVAGWVQAGDTWIGLRDGAPVGSLRIQEADPSLWPDRSDPARYIHRLVISRESVGEGVGRAILAAAEAVAAAQEIPLVRLDCGAGNTRLVRYYLDAGYRLIDIRPERTWQVARFEKVVR
jgi:GNAT superfamily N-acetyltransferase